MDKISRPTEGSFSAFIDEVLYFIKNLTGTLNLYISKYIMETDTLSTYHPLWTGIEELVTYPISHIQKSYNNRQE